MRTVGVEEEYLLVGPDGAPAALASAVLHASVTRDDAVPFPAVEQPDPPEEEVTDVRHEFAQQQVETATRPCDSLADVVAEVRAARHRVADAAARAGANVAALGTSPLTFTSTVVPQPRYRAVAAAFGLTAREQLTNGCHVHVAVADDDEGVAVLDRIRSWLAPLLAISANSPFWQGDDSGYASFRSQVWARWPTSGPTRAFGSPAAYRAAVAALAGTATILDERMVYFDARLSPRWPTVEIRVADVCLDAGTAVLLAALGRALVETAARSAAAGEPAPEVHAELLRAASWRAGRSGLTADLVDPRTWRPASARDVIGALVEHVREALTDAGDLDAVTDLLGELEASGDGATRQRAWAAESGGDLGKVALRAVEATLA
jgi:glutamate---cysteine ligase / carboxylate-amine ligase